MYVITVLNKISKVWQPTLKGFAAHRLKNWSKCTTLEMIPVLYIFLELALVDQIKIISFKMLHNVGIKCLKGKRKYVFCVAVF